MSRSYETKNLSTPDERAAAWRSRPAQVLTAAEAAERTGLRRATLQRWCLSGRLPFTRGKGNRFEILAEFLSDVTVERDAWKRGIAQRRPRRALPA